MIRREEETFHHVMIYSMTPTYMFNHTMKKQNESIGNSFSISKQCKIRFIEVLFFVIKKKEKKNETQDKRKSMFYTMSIELRNKKERKQKEKSLFD